MIRRPPRSTLSSSSAASDVYKRQRQSSESKQPLLDGMPLQRRRAKPVGEADVQDLRIEGAALGRSVAAEMPGELGDSPRHNQGVTNFMRIDGTGADILRLHSAVQLQANFRCHCCPCVSAAALVAGRTWIPFCASTRPMTSPRSRDNLWYQPALRTPCVRRLRQTLCGSTHASKVIRILFGW
eukprot:TRINITY_DN2148_c0_g1_i6.p1 TRINITY_DN2148_c0_g1~~TRINITY_DN2148_c0_g1_i6.p1  ORF type:complete len:183 (-),score=14.41 TRINITY_DN2148_c0_g1_i6:509-1057(-)